MPKPSDDRDQQADDRHDARVLAEVQPEPGPVLLHAVSSNRRDRGVPPHVTHAPAGRGLSDDRVMTSTPEVALQRLHDRDRAVGLAVRLEVGGHGARPAHGRSVHRVAHLRALAALGAEADVGPPGLVVGEPRHRADLEPHVAARRVGLDVPGARRRRADVAGAEVEDPVRQPELGEQRLAASEDVLLARDGLLGPVGEREQLHLVELVHAQQPAGVAARRARLAPEARGVGGVAERAGRRRRAPRRGGAT